MVDLMFYVERVANLAIGNSFVLIREMAMHFFFDLCFMRGS